VKSKTVLAGSILTSVAASICCIGPVLAILFGIRAFAGALRFDAWRPYLLGLTGLLIVAAFYLTYRNRNVRCADSGCAPSHRSKMLLWVIVIIVVAAAAFPYYSGAILKAQTKNGKASAGGEGDADKATTTIRVSGMTCGGCADQIQSMLVKIPGVKAADVSFEKGKAVVSFDPKVTGVEAIRAAIEEIGYRTDESKEAAAQPAVATTNALAGLPVNKLKEEFNRLSEKVRVVALLSPTCGACQQGRGIVGELFEKQTSEKLAGFAVWLPMKPKDSPQTAWLESEKLKDERVSVRGWDNERQIGNLFAKPLKLSTTAWDVYLVYASGIKWEGKQPPKPSYWMHQLRGQRADRMLCLNPAALSAQVELFLTQGLKGATSQVDSTRISFYTVPLVCGAAPEIGCGSRAKPILRELERNPAVADAWLNRPGTVIAVQWAKDSTAAERAEAITATANKCGLSILKLSGDERKTVRKEIG
jgi:mercuric ion transport protein